MRFLLPPYLRAATVSFLEIGAEAGAGLDDVGAVTEGADTDEALAGRPKAHAWGRDHLRG